MGRERPFELGEGDSKTSTMRSGLDVAKEYVRCKMVRRVSRLWGNSMRPCTDAA